VAADFVAAKIAVFTASIVAALLGLALLWRAAKAAEAGEA